MIFFILDIISIMIGDSGYYLNLLFNKQLSCCLVSIVLGCSSNSSLIFRVFAMFFWSLWLIRNSCGCYWSLLVLSKGGWGKSSFLMLGSSCLCVEVGQPQPLGTLRLPGSGGIMAMSL